MKYSATQYAKVFSELIADTPQSETMEVIREFIGVVSKNGGLSILPDIITEIEAEEDKKLGIRRVVVKSTERLSETAISHKLPFKARVKSERDVRLQAGTVIEVDDLRIDNSLKMRLERLKKAFIK